MRKFAVFDVDGTLIRWQLYHSMVDRLAELGHLGINGHEELHDQRLRWKTRANSNAFSDYEQFLVAKFQTSLENINQAVVDRLADEVVKQYRDQVYTYTLNLLQQLRAKNYFLIIISGSHQELIDRLAEYYGFDYAVGSQFYSQNNNLANNQPDGLYDKGSQLRQIIKDHHLSTKDSYAIGDSQSDISMLSLVENPIAFNPNLTLYNHAKSKHWPIVIERKNVIYQLENQGHGYQLV